MGIYCCYVFHVSEGVTCNYVVHGLTWGIMLVICYKKEAMGINPSHF